MRINIRPGVGVLGTFKAFNYRPWFALAEFVDNSLTSFLLNRAALQKVGVKSLKVEIDFDRDNQCIAIRDNAAGIRKLDLERAFKAAEIPPNTSLLSEFGMGMKNAACWFAGKWTVRTTALGEGRGYKVALNIQDIVTSQNENIDVETFAVEESEHFTEIRLMQLHHIPQTKTITKIRDHLTSIYRQFLRSREMSLRIFGEDLSFEEPEVLSAPNTLVGDDSTPVVWKKGINFQLSDGKRVSGFAGIRRKGSTSEAGFGLFRRKRLIVGSADEPFRPAEIFGQGNSYESQRLYGELHLDDFAVSYTKDGFRFEGSEEEFLSRLRDAIDSPPLNLRAQCRLYRAKREREEVVDTAEKVVTETAKVVQEYAGPIVDSEVSEAAYASPVYEAVPPANDMLSVKEFELVLSTECWRVRLELIQDSANENWLSIGPSQQGQQQDLGVLETLTVRMNLAHPFSQRFIDLDEQSMQASMRIAAGLGLAEGVARKAGYQGAGQVRHTLNQLLREALSHP